FFGGGTSIRHAAFNYGNYKELKMKKFHFPATKLWLIAFLPAVILTIALFTSTGSVGATALGKPDANPESPQSGRSGNRQGEQRQGGQEETIKVDATLVNIPVTVSDEQGRFIPGLKNEDFELYEDDVRQGISFFSADNVPFSLALVLDVSGSTRDSFQEI